VERLYETRRRRPVKLTELLQVRLLIVGQLREVVGDIGALLHRHAANISAPTQLSDSGPSRLAPALLSPGGPPTDGEGGEDPDGIATEWVIAANLLFLSGMAAYSGPSSSMIARAGQREPEITSLMRIVSDTALRQPVLRDALAPAWPDIQAAVRERRSRHGPGA
jgi:hypothetical protein